MTTLIGTIIDKVRDALVQDETFKAWTEHEDNLGKHPIVYVGEDDDDPPPKGNYPILCVCMVNRAESGQKNAVAFEIGFYAGVSNKEVVKDNEENPKYIVHSGFKKAEELREEAEKAIARVIMKSDGWMFEGEGESIPENKKGIYRSYSTVRISIKQGMIKPFYKNNSS